jgi:hypothetical protein
MSSHTDSFVASGTSPTPDFLCENHGSIFLLRPVSPASFDWIESHLPSDRTTFGNAVAVDHRCIDDSIMRFGKIPSCGRTTSD